MDVGRAKSRSTPGALRVGATATRRRRRQALPLCTPLLLILLFVSQDEGDSISLQSTKIQLYNKKYKSWTYRVSIKYCVFEDRRKYNI